MAQAATANNFAHRVSLRRCSSHDIHDMFTIINAAARAYEGAIPEAQWRDPYMSMEQLRAELDAGVAFWGAEVGGILVGVMGMEPRTEVDLIRHAYVLPTYQGLGIGGALLGLLVSRSRCPVLVGTWEGARWAVRFYERHGFVLESDDDRRIDLLHRYWRVPEEQMEAAVVLALPTVVRSQSREQSERR